MAHSITKNAFYNVLLNITSVIFPLITAPYVSRVLEPDGIGLYNFSTTYAGYFALVAMLGIPTYGVREVSKARDNKDALTKLISQLMSIATYTTLIVSIIYLLTIAFIGQLTENYIIFLLAGFAIYLAPFKINWYYQGIEDFGFITKVSLIVRTFSVIFLFLLVRDKSDLVIYIILSILGGAMADVWNFIKMWKSGVRPKLTLKGLKPHINPLLVLFASSIAISIYTVLDTLMLGFITDYEEVGYYTNAMHMSRVIITIVTSLSIVAVPRVSYYFKNKDYDNINLLMDKSFSVVSFIAFPVAIGMCCISPTFIPLFFGTSFVGSVVPMMILSSLVIIIGLNNLTGMQILIGMGFDKYFLYSMLAGTFSNLLLNTFLIPLWGAAGASISSVIAETLVLLVSGMFVFRKTHIRCNLYEILKSLLGALLFIPVYLVLKSQFDGWVLVGISIVLGGGVYLLIEAFLKSSSFELFKSIVYRFLSNNKVSG